MPPGNRAESFHAFQRLTGTSGQHHPRNLGPYVPPDCWHAPYCRQKRLFAVINMGPEFRDIAQAVHCWSKQRFSMRGRLFCLSTSPHTTRQRQLASAVTECIHVAQHMLHTQCVLATTRQRAWCAARTFKDMQEVGTQQTDPPRANIAQGLESNQAMVNAIIGSIIIVWEFTMMVTEWCSQVSLEWGCCPLLQHP